MYCSPGSRGVPGRRCCLWGEKASLKRCAVPTAWSLLLEKGACFGASWGQLCALPDARAAGRSGSGGEKNPSPALLCHGPLVSPSRNMRTLCKVLGEHVSLEMQRNTSDFLSSSSSSPCLVCQEAGTAARAGTEEGSPPGMAEVRDPLLGGWRAGGSFPSVPQPGRDRASALPALLPRLPATLFPCLFPFRKDPFLFGHGRGAHFPLPDPGTGCLAHPAASVQLPRRLSGQHPPACGGVAEPALCREQHPAGRCVALQPAGPAARGPQTARCHPEAGGMLHAAVTEGGRAEPAGPLEGGSRFPCCTQGWVKEPGFLQIARQLGRASCRARAAALLCCSS